MKEIYLKCVKCGNLFKYRGVGRPPKRCETCRRKGYEIDLGEQIINGERFKVVQKINKDGSEGNIVFVRIG